MLISPIFLHVWGSELPHRPHLPKSLIYKGFSRKHPRTHPCPTRTHLGIPLYIAMAFIDKIN